MYTLTWVFLWSNTQIQLYENILLSMSHTQCRKYIMCTCIGFYTWQCKMLKKFLKNLKKKSYSNLLPRRLFHLYCEVQTFILHFWKMKIQSNPNRIAKHLAAFSPTESLLAHSCRLRNIPSQYCYAWLVFPICYPRYPLQDPWPDRILAGVGLTQTGHSYTSLRVHMLQFIPAKLFHISYETHLKEIFCILMSH